ncbi:MAG: DUF4013 domain-containing protein [Vulcanimicrobiota bacterium]
MSRGSWSEISSDSDVWKKIVLGGICLLTVLPIPVALGGILEDLEAESANIKSDSPPGKFPEMDNFGVLLGKGLAPAVMFFVALMLFCLPTVVLMMTGFQIFASFRGEHGIAIMSVLVSAIFGLVALSLQFITAAMFPVAMAQYGRGMNLQPAMSPLANFSYVMEMGAAYWKKAAGFWFFLFGNIIVYIHGPIWYVNVPIQVALAVLGFTSLVIAARFALNQLQTKL